MEEINKKLDEITSNNFKNSSDKQIDNKNDKFDSSYFINKHPIVTSVSASIFASLIVSLFGTLINLTKFPSEVTSRLDVIESKLDNLENDDVDMEKRISKLEAYVFAIADKTGINHYSELEYTESFISELSIKSESIENKYYASEPPCQNEDIIAKNIESGEEYTKEQLTGEKLLIPYTSNGQEILFYGQYNENNKWDKDCTTNVYKNNKLILISETVYDDGEPLYSKMVYPYETKGKINVWCITNRKYDKNFNNIDETWSYFKVNENSKSFDLKDAEIDNLLYVSQFESTIKKASSLEGYYCDIIDGNDKKTFMVKNDEKGFVKTFYIGKFENGDFHDNTGKAEEIVFDESVNKYFYYNGKFVDGKRSSNNDLKYKTQDEINEIIKPYEFNCELNWHDTTKDTD